MTGSVSGHGGLEVNQRRKGRRDIFILLVPLAVLAGVIVAIVKLIKTPKPPAGLSRSELNWWYFEGGWKVAQREEELRRLIEEDKKNVHNDICDYLLAGQKMEAIKRYKDYYECSLNEAMTAISEIEWELEYERLHEEKDEDAFIDEILDYLKLGQRVEAIKRYQEYYGYSFEEAKTAIYEIDYRTGYQRINESETPG